MALVRHLLGAALREERLRQGRSLRDVSRQAKVSLGYISEVERGVKEASSECLAAICSALDVPLSRVLHTVSVELDRAEAVAGEVAAASPVRVPGVTPIGRADSHPEVVAAA